MNVAARIGQIVLAVISVMCMLIAISVFFVEDPFHHDARVLIGSFGVGMGAFALINVARLGGDRWAWASLWVLPAFFVWHVIALGTVVPDGVLAVVSAVCLGATRPRRSATTSGDVSLSAASR